MKNITANLFRKKKTQMNNINNLHNAKIFKNDEYYTRIEDIEREICHYKYHLKNKIILCNCDNPEYSSFWKYFHLNFNSFGLKSLICIYYNGNKSSYKFIYNGGNDDNIHIYNKVQLKYNGDFRNNESIKILIECDIVVTNPPFSLFREYILQLIKYNKKFIILGSNNAITYKEIFILFKNNIVWFGYLNWSSELYFKINQEYKEFLLSNKKNGSGYKIINGEVYARVGCMWYTNLDLKKRHEEIVLNKKYNLSEYEMFDELPNVINVNKVIDIPCDYNGYIGVPISFMDKYNPEQFEIIDAVNRYTDCDYFGVNLNVKKRHAHCCSVNGHIVYKRIIIRKK